MEFNMKQARDGNTTSYWTPTIWRVFIDDKLFVSDNGRSVFDSIEEATEALHNSRFYAMVESYIDYSQRFFDKIGDSEWRKEFSDKVYGHMKLEYKQYFPK
jgi:hypothetical protein